MLLIDMPRIVSGSIRCLRKERCLETLFTGGDIAWTADGKRMYAMKGDEVKVIKVDNPLESFSISCEDALKLSSLVIDDSNSRLAIAYTNGLLGEMDISSSDARELRTWKSTHTSPVICMQYSPDSSLLATGSADCCVLVWDIIGNKLVAKLSGPSVVSSLLFISKTRVVIGYAEGVVRIFDAEKDGSFTLTHENKSHSSRITSLCLDESTGFVVVSSRDQTATVIDPQNGHKMKTVLLFEACEGCVVIPDSRLFTAGEEGTIKEWSLSSCKLIRSVKIADEGLEHIGYNCLRNEIVAITASHTLVFLNVSTLEVVRQIVGMHDEIFSLVLMGDSSEWLAVASNSPELRLYDMETFNCNLIKGHTSSIVSLAVPYWNSSLVASCAKDNKIIVWRLIKEEGKLEALAMCTGHTSTPSSLSFSHSSSKPYLLSTAYDTMLKMWPLSPLPSTAPSSIDKVIHLTCSSTIKAHAKDVTCVDVGASDAIAVTGGMDKMAKLWAVDTQSMQLGIVGNLSGHRRGVWDAKFSPSADKVATCSGDLLVRVYAVSDLSILATLEGHSSTVLKVLFVNKGTQLISADSGGVLRVWDVKSGGCDLAEEGHTDKIWALSSSREEGMYVSGGSDGRIIVWQDASTKIEEEEMQKAKKHEEEIQTLNNLMLEGKYVDALRFALLLERPHCALKLITQLSEEEKLKIAMEGLDEEHIIALLNFAAKWNTNTRTSHAAQSCLQCLVIMLPPEKILTLPGIGGILASLLPYTKRHSDRLNKAKQDISLLNYTWRLMRPAT